MSSWFISPWEAVRMSLEAQRLIALQFFPFGARTGQTNQEEETRDISAPSRKTVRARTVAARTATDVIRKATATRKLNGSKRKRKSNKQRG